MAELLTCDVEDFAGTNPMAVKPGAVLYDDFRALAIGTNLVGRVSDSGHTWQRVIDSGLGWTIDAGSGYGHSAASPGTHSFAGLAANLGSPDCDIEIQMDTADNVRWGVVVRAQQNPGGVAGWGFYTIGHDASSSRGAISRIWIPNSGSSVFTVLSTFDPALGTPGSGSFVRVVANGSDFDVYRNDQLVAQVTDSTYSSNLHGIYNRFCDDGFCHSVNMIPDPWPLDTAQGRQLIQDGLDNWPRLALNGSGGASPMDQGTWWSHTYETEIADVSVTLDSSAPSSSVTDLGPSIVVRKAPSDLRAYWISHCNSDRYRVRLTDAAGVVSSPFGASSFAAPVAFGAGVELTAETDGNDLRVYQNGTLLNTHSMDPSMAAFTQHGYGVASRQGGTFYNVELCPTHDRFAWVLGGRFGRA